MIPSVDPVDFWGAKAMCERLGVGWALPWIDDVSQLDWMASVSPPEAGPYIGVVQQPFNEDEPDSEGTLGEGWTYPSPHAVSSFDSVNAASTLWRPLQPDDALGEQDCAHLWNGRETVGALNDVRCSWTTSTLICRHGGNAWSNHRCSDREAPIFLPYQGEDTPRLFATTEHIDVTMLVDEDAVCSAVALAAQSLPPISTEVLIGVGAGGEAPLIALTGIVIEGGVAKNVRLSPEQPFTEHFELALWIACADLVANPGPVNIMSAPVVLATAIPDTTVPTILSSGVAARSSDGFYVAVQLSEAGTCYAVVGLPQAKAPTPAFIRDGGGQASGYVTLADGNDLGEIVLDGLLSGVAYVIYLTCTDDAVPVNAMSTVVAIAAETVDIVPPAATIESFSATGHSITLGIHVGEHGHCWAIALEPTADLPAVDDVASANSAQGLTDAAFEVVLTIPELTSEHTYAVFAVCADDAPAPGPNMMTEPVTMLVDTADVTGPVLSDVTVDERTGTSVTVSMTLNEAGTCFAATRSASTPIPSKAEVRSEGSQTGATIDIDNGGDSGEIQLLELTSEAQYYLFLTCLDDADVPNEIESAPVLVLAETTDITPPEIVLVAVSERTGSSLTVAVELSEGGACFALEQHGTTVSPSVSDVRAAGVTGQTVDGRATLVITELQSETEYDVFVTCIDDETVLGPNVMTTPPQVVSALTTDVTAPQMTSVALHERHGDSLVIQVDLDEGGTCFAVAAASGADPPSNAQILAEGADTDIVDGGGSGIILIGGLVSETLYDIYVACVDDETTPGPNVTPSPPAKVSGSTTDVTAPEYVEESPHFVAVAGVSAAVEVVLNEPGTCFAVAVHVGVEPPTVADVISGTGAAGSIAVAATDVVITADEETLSFVGQLDLMGLVSETDYAVYVVCRDDAPSPGPNQQVSVAHMSLRTTDITAPDHVVAPSVTNEVGDGAVLNVELNEGGICHVVVSSADAVAPVVENVIGGVGAGANDPLFADSVELSEGSSLVSTVVVSGLDSESDYVAYVVCTDDAAYSDAGPNVQSTVISIPFTTTDITAPQFSDGPEIVSVDGYSVEFSFSLDEDGEVFAIVVAADSGSPPTSAEVVAGTVEVIASESTAVIAGAASQLQLSGLASETEYVVYIVGRDDADTPSPNLQSSATRIEITTTDVTPPQHVGESPSITAVLGTSISVSFALDEPGSCFASAVVVVSGNDEVVAEEIPAGVSVAVGPELTASLQLTELESETAYTLYLVCEDDAPLPGPNRQADAIEVDVTTADVTSPSFLVEPSVSTASGSSLLLRMQLTEAGECYAVALSSDVPPPDVADVIEGTDGAGSQAEASAAGPASLTSVFEVNLLLAELQSETAYAIYVACHDDADAPGPNFQSSVVALDGHTLDVTPPAFVDGAPALLESGGDSLTIGVGLVEPGWCWATAVLEGTAPPDIGDVVVGTGAAASASTGVDDGEGAASILLEGLLSETAYVVHVVCEDDAPAPGPNRQELAAILDVVTADVTAPAFEGDASVDSVTGDAVDITIAISEPGACYAVAVSAGAPAPDVSDVISGTAGQGTVAAAAASGETAADDELEVTLSLAQLDSETDYVIFVACHDAVADPAPNFQTEPLAVAVTTLDVTPPEFAGDPELVVREGTSIGIAVELTEPGSCWAAAIDSGDQPLSVDDLLQGSGIAPTNSEGSEQHDLLISVVLEDLVPDTTYVIYFICGDAAPAPGPNIMAESAHLTVTTRDITPPLFAAGYPEVGLVRSSSASVQFQLSEAGRCWAIADESQTVPSVAEVMSGAQPGTSGTCPQCSAESATDAASGDDNGGVLSLSELRDGTTYHVHVACSDDDGNEMAAVASLVVRTQDTTAPSFSNGYPGVSVTHDSLTFIIKLEGPGNVHWAVLQFPSDRPTPEQLLQGQDASGASIAASGHVDVGDDEVARTVGGLAEAGMYDVYLIASDAAGNTHASVSQLTVQTLDVSPPNFESDPQVSSLDWDAVELAFVVDEASRCVATVATANVAAPSAGYLLDIDASEPPTDAPFAAFAGGTFSSGGSLALWPLAPVTDYVAYIVCEDTPRGNSQDDVTSVEFSTPCAEAAHCATYVCDAGACADRPGTATLEWADFQDGTEILEGGTVTSNVALSMAPVRDVTLRIFTSGTSVVVSPETATWGTDNWDTAVSFAMTPMSDDVDGDDYTVDVSIESSSEDPFFDGLSVTRQLRVVDDDTAGFVVSAASLTLAECATQLLPPLECGGNAHGAVHVMLTSQPTEDISVSVTQPSPGLQVMAQPAVLTVANWRSGIDLEFAVVGDDVATGTRDILAVVAFETPDAGYSGMSIPFDVIVEDDDTAGLVVSAEPVVVDESSPEAAGSYTLRLMSQPVDTVTVSIIVDALQLLASASVLEFDEQSWNAPQTVEVFPVVDGPGESAQHPSEVLHVVSSSDPRYFTGSFLVPSVTVSITDEGASLDLSPAPQLSAAVLSEVSEHLTVTFDVTTNRAGFQVGVGVPCNDAALFQLETSALFGSGASCQWTSDADILISLDDDHAVGGGTRLIVKTGRIRVADNGYYSAVGSIEVQGRTPPPTPVQLKMEDSGAVFVMRFDPNGSPSTLTLGEMPGHRPCREVFKDSTELLGSLATCAWEDAYTLYIASGHGATIVPDFAQTPGQCRPGRSLRLISGAIHAVPSGVLSSGGCLPVTPADNPPTPVAQLSARPQVLGACTPLVVDATMSSGLGGRDAVYTWTLLEDGEGHSDGELIADAIAEATAANLDSFVIPSDLVPYDSSWTLGLEVANQFSTVTSTTRAVVSKSSREPVIVSIQGPPAVEIFRSEELTLLSSAAMPRCDGSPLAVDVDIEWRVSSYEVLDENVAPSAVQVPELSRQNFRTRNPYAVRVPPSSFSVGVVYTIEVRATPTSAPERWNTATATLEILNGDVVADIGGGHEVVVGTDNPVEFDASGSWDQNDSDEPWSFDWACTVISTTSDGEGALAGEPCVGFDGELIAMGDYTADVTAPVSVVRTGSPPPAGSGIVLPAGLLLANAVYEVTVLVRKGFRVSSTAVTVGVVPGAPPTVGITELLTKVNAYTEVTINAAVSAANIDLVTLLWSQDTGDLEFPSEETPLTASPLALPPTSSTLRIKPHVLTESAQYTFRLSATGPGGTGAATTRVTVNRPPIAGFGEVSPPDGVFGDAFTLRALNWVDDDLPLEYQWSYTVGASNEPSRETRLFQFSREARLDTNLIPQGQGRDGLLSLAVYARDSLGAPSRSTSRGDGSPYQLFVRPFIAENEDELVDFIRGASHAFDRVAADAEASVVVSNIQLLAHSLSDQCAGVECGDHGTCAFGECECHEGWSELHCDTPDPVDGHWGAWSEWSECDASCGGGTRTRTRECLGIVGRGAHCSDLAAARRRLDDGEDGEVYDGSDYDGEDDPLADPTASSQTVPCNAHACAGRMDGGWSEWTTWSACSTACEPGIGGFNVGIQQRSRSCTSPAPSSDGAQCGEAQDMTHEDEVRECNTDECPWPLKECPGSVIDEWSGQLTPCNGHGMCVRSPLPDCEERSDDCDATCVCVEGWNGRDCGFSDAVFAERQRLRQQLIAGAADALTRSDPSPEVAEAQARALLNVVQSADELSADGLGAAADLAHVISRVSAANGHAAASLLDALSALLIGADHVFLQDGDGSGDDGEAPGSGGVDVDGEGNDGEGDGESDGEAYDGERDAAARALSLRRSPYARWLARDRRSRRMRDGEGDPLSDGELGGGEEGDVYQDPYDDYAYDGVESFDGEEGPGEDGIEDLAELNDLVSSTAHSVLDGILSDRIVGEDAVKVKSKRLTLTGRRLARRQRLDDISIACGGGRTIQFPRQVADKIRDSGDVDFRGITWERDPRAGKGSPLSVVSSVLDMKFTKVTDSTEVAIHDLAEPVIFHMRLRPTLAALLSGKAKARGELPRCATLDETTQAWTEAGVVELGLIEDEPEPGCDAPAGMSMICATTHFSKFAALSSIDLAQVPPPSAQISPQDVVLVLDPSNGIMVFVLVGVILVFTTCWCVFASVDRKHADVLREKRKRGFLLRGTLDSKVVHAEDLVDTDDIDLLTEPSLLASVRSRVSFWSKPRGAQKGKFQEFCALAAKRWWLQMRTSHNWLESLYPLEQDL